MKQDRLQRAKERYADYTEAMREQHARMREDLRFSNFAKPEQWSADAIALRRGRPTLTFDNTNKFIRQVANDGAASVPSIQTIPADGFAHAKAAEALNGRIRHIEYSSRASVAYDTSLDLAARCGLGWIRIVPKILNPETNQQEPQILRIKSPFECGLDPSWIEPDGSDAEFGFVLSPVHKKKFKLMHPKAEAGQGWEDTTQLWTMNDTILIAEYFEFELTKVHKVMIETPDGERIALTDDEFGEVSYMLGQQGIRPEVVGEFDMEDRKVTWTKMTGCEELESTDFPSRYIPIVPVIGSEIWIEGERYLSGLTRELMDGQRMHNAEMSAYIESILSQPKAPFMAAMRAIEGHEAAWAKLNTGNPAFLPYNDIDPDNPTNPTIARPDRLSPPQMPSAFTQGAVMGSNAMMNSVGIYRSGLGQETANAVSGVAKQQDRRESNTSTYHYGKNRAISLQQVGRILIDMDRRLTDTARTVRTMSEDGKSGQIRFDPHLRDAVAMKGTEVTAINPTIGEYDLRVKIGPSYLTQNEETASELGAMFQGAPQLLPVLGPLWAQLKGVPNVEMVKKLLVAMAPSPVQEIYAEESKEGQQPLPPQARAAMQQMQQQIQQLSGALENAAAEADKTQVEKAKVLAESQKTEADMLLKAYSAVTDRLKVTGMQTPEQIAALVRQTVLEALAIKPLDPDEMGESGEPGEGMRTTQRGTDAMPIPMGGAMPTPEEEPEGFDGMEPQQ